MVHPLDWMGSVLVMHSCQFHLCVPYAYGLCACFICMALVIVTVVSSCEKLMVLLLDVVVMSVCRLCMLVLINC